MLGRYRVVTLCGSPRFADVFMEEARRLTAEGNIVLSPFFGGGAAPAGPGAEVMANMQMRRIDICDEVFVVNVGGYVDEETAREVDYARSNGRKVAMLVG